MHKMIFVNLPVKNVARTKAFFSSLGYTFDPRFSNDTALSMKLGENLFAMLLHEDFFKTFTKKPVADASKGTEAIVCLSCESREEVDALVAKAVAAGATTPNPKQDHGFMYGHGFEDLDGHVWELMWMDPNGMPPHSRVRSFDEETAQALRRWAVLLEAGKPTLSRWLACRCRHWRCAPDQRQAQGPSC